MAAALSLLATGCGETGFDVFVDLRTDLAPGVEFDHVRTELLTDVELGTDARARINEFTVSEAGDYSEGIRVAEFGGVSEGTFMVRVQLTVGTGIVAERVVRVELRGSTGVPVVITRTCRGVSCPRDGDPSDAVSCVGGLCQAPECATGREAACAAPQCSTGTDCPAPPAACAAAACVDGLCFDVLDDGACTDGELCHADLACVDTSTCVPLTEICNGFDDDCDGTVDEDFDLTADRDHCGACGTQCLGANGTASCSAGTCVVACDAGFADCNSSPGDGCETDLSAPQDCGGCGTACTAPTPLCEAIGGGSFACASDCGAGTTLCGSSCVDTTSSANHCGGCDMPCAPLSGASVRCAGSLCDFACDARRGDCNRDASDGCEADLTRDPNCGTCDTACSEPRRCGGGGEAGVCGCTPRAACIGAQDCGTQPDDCGGTISCGTCTDTDTCGGGGAMGECGCTPITSCPGVQDCGTRGDGCGGTISCDSCRAPDTCGGGAAGTPGTCGCTPITACVGSQDCSTQPDGCGGTISCGTCTGSETCGGGGVVGECGCTPITSCPDGQNCGSVPNGCGRSLSCGTCSVGDECGGLPPHCRCEGWPTCR